MSVWDNLNITPYSFLFLRGTPSKYISRVQILINKIKKMVVTTNNVGVKVVNFHGVVTSIQEKVNNLNNNKKTPYRIGATKIDYPDGSSTEIATRFYTKSIEAHPDVFKVGSKIGLEIQAEGEYKGRAVAKLHGEVVDVDKLLGLNAASTTPAATPTQKQPAGESVDVVS